MNVILFLVLSRMFWRRKYDGQVLWTTMVLYGVGRFLVEFTRGDDEARGFFGSLSTAQWISLATIAFGLLLRARLPHTPVKPLAPLAPAPTPRGAPHGRGAA
jgi:prolipoprotein diacylglyceryltransferase